MVHMNHMMDSAMQHSRTVQQLTVQQFSVQQSSGSQSSSSQSSSSHEPHDGQRYAALSHSPALSAADCSLEV